MLLHLALLELGQDPRDHVRRGAGAHGVVEQGHHKTGRVPHSWHVVDDGLANGGDKVRNVVGQELLRGGIDKLRKADADALAHVRVTCGEGVHEDRHQLRHYPLAQLTHKVTHTSRRHALLLAVRGGEVRDEASHEGRQQLLECPRRVLHHSLPDLRASLLHNGVLVASHDVEGREHVRAPLLRQHIALHQLGTVCGDPVCSQDLLDELAHKLHRRMANAPVHVEDALLQRLQELRSVGRAKLLGDHLGRLEGCVSHR
mmetsp:Transcript_52469/g.168251  ORF Transcript_52469/g.168251 Transcript_52469/m.168251 type:complete len:258 (-) Transcript_52469:302-1075(-)